jgi:hypothetical protein
LRDLPLGRSAQRFAVRGMQLLNPETHIIRRLCGKANGTPLLKQHLANAAEGGVAASYLTVLGAL